MVKRANSFIALLNVWSMLQLFKIITEIHLNLQLNIRITAKTFIPHPNTCIRIRGVPIIGTANISATDMLIFTVLVIGADKLKS